MRKRSIKCVADTIFWYIIYMLPVIAYLIWVFAVCGNSGFEGITISDMRTVLNFGSFCSFSRFEIIQQNIIYTTLYGLFGNSGSVFKLFNNDVLMIFSWFIATYLLHLVVDFLLFIPKLAMKWMNYFTNTED